MVRATRNPRLMYRFPAEPPKRNAERRSPACCTRSRRATHAGNNLPSAKHSHRPGHPNSHCSSNPQPTP